MKQDVGYNVITMEYSKKLSSCASGNIVAQKNTRLIILSIPELCEKEQKFFISVLEELKKTDKTITSRGDVYFFLKEYCLENMVLLNKEQREKMLILLEWESLGESILTPILKDPEFEEIVINGPKKPILVYHQTFGWLITNVEFTNEEKIKTIINKMAAPLGRQISYHTPMLNAVLRDGSRLNASMNPVAFTGINATIRKFKENPLTPVDLIDYGTITKEAMAFLWITMQTSSSILICGNTGSGKTTTLNTLFCFLPREERIVSAEETPELMLPQTHIVKLNTAEQLNISLNVLIDNTFRMRPDRVIVGEIRNGEEASAFVNTMLAGQARGSYATFHAESAKEALQRLISFGVDKQTLASLDAIIVQKRINRIDSEGVRREERRVTEICEIEKIESGVNAKALFEYSYTDGVLKKTNNSKRIMQKMMQTFSATEKEVYGLIKEKQELLGKLSGNVTFKEFFELAERECLT